jgi:hypothetical protein
MERKKENMNAKALFYEIEKEEIVYSLNYQLSFLIFSAKNKYFPKLLNSFKFCTLLK